jgi:hypothetical protein
MTKSMTTVLPLGSVSCRVIPAKSAGKPDWQGRGRDLKSFGGRPRVEGGRAVSGGSGARRYQSPRPQLADQRMSFLSDHPGYLGLTSKGALAIHADWPTYPAEHGWEVALRSLGQYPRRCRFVAIDDIDECFLLMADIPPVARDPYDERNSHVAVWHEDMWDLHREGLIEGVIESTFGEWIERRRIGLVRTLDDGTTVPVRLPTIEDFGEEEDQQRLMVVADGIVVTKTGWLVLEKALVKTSNELHPSLMLRALPIVNLGQFDSAVREACLLLEVSLRRITSSKLHGQALVARFIDVATASRRFISAQIKVLRSELRATFRYVRNEYMHNQLDLTRPQCMAMLMRVSALLFFLDDVDRILQAPAPPVG